MIERAPLSMTDFASSSSTYSQDNAKYDFSFSTYSNNQYNTNYTGSIGNIVYDDFFNSMTLSGNVEFSPDSRVDGGNNHYDLYITFFDKNGQVLFSKSIASHNGWNNGYSSSISYTINRDDIATSVKYFRVYASSYGETGGNHPFNTCSMSISGNILYNYKQ
jgi:hypothetical protein